MHSTVTALLDATTEWYLNILNKEYFLWCPTGIGSSSLFLIYITELPYCRLNYSKVRMFADNTNSTASAENLDELQHLINKDLKSINQWLLANKLTLI